VLGAVDQVVGPALLLALPIAVREFTVGVWMAAKGVRTPATGELPDAAARALMFEPAAA
jgi:hypothetical protein